MSDPKASWLAKLGVSSLGGGDGGDGGTVTAPPPAGDGGDGGTNTAPPPAGDGGDGGPPPPSPPPPLSGDGGDGGPLPPVGDGGPVPLSSPTSGGLSSLGGDGVGDGSDGVGDGSDGAGDGGDGASELSTGKTRKVDVQINAIDWDGSPITGFQGFVKFTAPSSPEVDLSGKITQGQVSFSGASLAPQGSMFIQAVAIGGESDATTSPSGITNYSLPRSGILTFRAAQGVKVVKVTAKTSTEASSKVGVKGTVGVDFKVASASTEVSGEDDDKKGQEKEIEWTVTIGLDSFVVTQQS